MADLRRCVIATPLPYQFLGHDRCGQCGRRFWGRGRRNRYEAHWQMTHARSDSGTLTEVTVRKPPGGGTGRP
jgi:hypothetical protein